MNLRVLDRSINIQQSLEYNEHAPFAVDLDVITKYIGKANKHRSKKILNRSYIKNVDYIIVTLNDDQEIEHSINNREIILMTIICFKKICLQSSDKAVEKTIDYYSDLEQLMIKYQNILISKLIESCGLH